MTYHYSMLRFVPDAARGEFVNLGAIAGDDDSGDWDVRLISGLRRAKALDEEARIGTALAFVASLEAHVVEEEGSNISTTELTRLAEEMQNVVQLSPPAPIVAESATAALDVIFDELVVDPASRAPSTTKWRAVRETFNAYRDHEVPGEAIARRAPVHSRAYSAVFDFAIHNGQAVQLVQCWSFRVLGQTDLAEQVKSWAWTVRDLTEAGGNMVAEKDGAEFAVPTDVEIAAVVIPPSADNDARAFEEASAAFEDTHVLVVEADDADQIGAHAAERLNTPSAGAV